MKKMNWRVLVKAGIIMVLLLLLLIPVAFVNGIISGRLNYKAEALSKITKSWGEKLVIAAPVLNVSAVQVTENKDKEKSYSTKYFKYTPTVLDVKTQIKPQVRYIGIFKTPVFTADIKMTGSFIKPETGLSSQKQYLSLEINDLKGISSSPQVTIDGKKLEFAPLTQFTPLSINDRVSREHIDSFAYKSYSTYPEKENLKILGTQIETSKKEIPFEIEFSIKGSGSINFVPVAKQNRFEISSDWTSPNFSGSFLPDTKEISSKGFNAVWNINYLASGIASQIQGQDVSSSMFKTTLLFPVDNYRNAERAVKYAVLFIALTFLVCFVFEITRSKPIHPFQYALVGLAMAVFYLLLISLSEFIAFGFAYFIAALATVVLLTLYTRYAIIKESAPKQMAFVAFILSFLYAYLYTLLQLEDLSLILGSVGLFAGIAAAMYATRNINWYEDQ